MVSFPIHESKGGTSYNLSTRKLLSLCGTRLIEIRIIAGTDRDLRSGSYPRNIEKRPLAPP
jgi:hypothetical protein